MRNPKPYQTRFSTTSYGHHHTLTLALSLLIRCIGPINALVQRCCHNVSWHLCSCFGANCIFLPASRKHGGSTRTTQKKKKKVNNKRRTLIKNLITRRKNLYLVCSISPLRSSVSMLQPEVLLKSTIDISSLFYHFQSEDRKLDLR